MVLPLTTAGAKRDTKPSRGYSSGQAMPITPTGSWMRTVQPYSVVSCKEMVYDHRGQAHEIDHTKIGDMVSNKVQVPVPHDKNKIGYCPKGFKACKILLDLHQHIEFRLFSNRPQDVNQPSISLVSLQDSTPQLLSTTLLILELEPT